MSAKINQEPSLPPRGQVTKEILSARQKLQQDKNKTAWEINNGLCDIFAEDIIKKLGAESGKFYVMSFIGMVVADKYNCWDNFNPESIVKYSIEPTHNLASDVFNQTIKKYADDTHVWVVLHDNEGVWHFDAECPNGVKNPMHLPSYDKFLVARACGIENKEDLRAFLHRWKVRSEEAQNIQSEFSI